MRVVIVALGFACGTSIAVSAPLEDTIRPLLVIRCAGCHGPDAQESGLRLDVRHRAFKGGDFGPVIVPGDAAASELVRRITSTDEKKMMPPDGERLSAAEIAVIRGWIDAGAEWPETDADRVARETDRDPRLDHWAWRPVVRPAVPPPHAGWPMGNEIDRFLQVALADKGLAPAPEADRRTLMRRLSFDLLGLPPSPEDVAAFVTDAAPDAYEQLVERLLASPHYGERQARHWLDIAHYADTHGFERDQLRPHAWRYRDWVIDALNRDLPYDDFLRRQIAGDVLAPDDPEHVIASGFLAAGPWDFVGQVETKSDVLRRQARADDLDDMVTQVMTAACGVTINCARCHDHKLDPVSQREYYALVAVFAGVKRAEAPTSRVEQERYARRHAELTAEVAATRAEVQALTGKEPLAAAEARLVALEQRLASLEPPARFFGPVSEPPPAVRVHVRGNPEAPGAEVSPGTISAVAGLPTTFGDTALPDGERRRALADWITSPDNPLTPRVIVNRLWHHHFGTGIVDTPSDFGIGGGRPSHPELLDWLAAEIVARQWSLKAMHRLICTSHAYRQRSADIPDAAPARALDADNRLLWRQSPRRLDAESLRDATLAVSGCLNTAMHGPGYRDFDYEEAYAPIYRYVTPDAPPLWRRSIYRFIVRSTPHAFLTTLDCPNPANLTPARLETTTALQSLALLNNDFMLRQAGYWARRLEREAGAEPAAQVRRGFGLAFAREPDEAELAAAIALVRSAGLVQFCRMLFNTNEFVYVD